MKGIMSHAEYLKTIENFHEQQNKGMTKDPLNWFSVAGLLWLEEGDNVFGIDESNNLILPAQADAQSGVLRLENGNATLLPAPNVSMRVNDRAAVTESVQTDEKGEPDYIELGTLTMAVIKRGDFFLLRVWDRESPAVKNFSGLNFYPIKPEYCVEAQFIRYDPPKILKTLSVIGVQTDTVFSGQARFTLNGAEYSLEAEKTNEGLLFNFKDNTKKDTTYPGGRRIKTPDTQEDTITLDFNYAINWPCAYTAYATCPVPPAENNLDTRIEAGEMKYYL